LFLTHIRDVIREKSEEVFAVLGHVRYSTTGGYWDSVVQPIIVGDDDFKVALAFNGTIPNHKRVMEQVCGIECHGKNVKSDTESLALSLYHVAREFKKDVVEGLKELSRYIIGGYSVLVATSEPRIIIARDPWGFRPLAYALEGDELYIASETGALTTLGITNWREVEPGEIISYDGKSIERTSFPVKREPAPCIFEYVYFSRPDSVFNGISVYNARYRMGEILGREFPVEGDIVVPVPDSARIAALGYSRATGIPIAEALIANKYIGRVFINPPITRLKLAVLKYGVVQDIVAGKRVVLIDDSIVRGTTMKYLISKIRKSGARKIHVRISSPPFKCPCFMGIDVASRLELAVWRARGIDDIRREIGADSLNYNTLDGLVKAVGLSRVCHACFSCSYPFNGVTMEELEEMVRR